MKVRLTRPSQKRGMPDFWPLGVFIVDRKVAGRLYSVINYSTQTI